MVGLETLTQNELFYVLIFMKKLCVWLFDLRRYAKQSETRKFYDISAEKYTHFMTGGTLFQSNISVCVFKVEIYILKQIKKSALHLFSC